MKTCPYCFEDVLEEAVKCKHCHEFIVDEFPEDLLAKRKSIQFKLGVIPSPSVKKMPVATGGTPEQNTVLWQGGPSILYWAGAFVEITLLALFGLFVAFGGGLLAEAGYELPVPILENMDFIKIMQIKFVMYVGLAIVAIAVFALIKTWLSIIGAGKYTVSVTRISERTGLISNRTNEIRVADIRGINLRQTIGQRILGLGTLEIGSAASAGQEIYFRGIRKPNEVREVIIGAQSNA